MGGNILLIPSSGGRPNQCRIELSEHTGRYPESYLADKIGLALGGGCAPASTQGQLLVVDPLNELVIVRYASPPMAPPERFDNLWWPIVDAITEAVTG